MDTVIEENKAAYPELVEKADYIKKVVKNEEEAFNNTIGKGMDMLMQLIDKASTDEIRTLSGAEAFKLYDTYGFPHRPDPGNRGGKGHYRRRGRI